MVLALQAGEVDYVHGVDFANVKRLQSDSNIRLTRWVNGGLYFVGMVVDYPPLRDARVRQAIAFALDRKRFAAEFGEGLSEPAIQLWVKGSPGYFADQESLVTYDPERAKSLLQQAGYGSGLTIPYDVGNLAIRTSAAQFNQDDLKKVGINLDIQVSEYSAYLERFRSRRIEAAWPSNTGSTNTMHPAWTFASDQAIRIPNASHYEPADYKAFLDGIYSLDPRSPQGREQLRAFNKRSILDEVWITGLMERVSYYAARKRLSGIDANGGRRGWPVDWWLSA
jgi:peptide/nickel transport system substrate-binding protein